MAGVKEIMGKPVDTAERDRYRNVALHAAWTSAMKMIARLWERGIA